jgi:hypothetical protein
VEVTDSKNPPLSLSVEGTVQWRPPSEAASAKPAVPSDAGTIFPEPIDATKAVNDDFIYWSGRLTEYSVQLSYAVIAGCWAVFKTKDQILGNHFVKLSLACAIGGIAINLIGAHALSEEHRAKVAYAEADLSRWRNEWQEETGHRSAWPFGKRIVITAAVLRQIKFILPLMGGALFLLALFRS